MNKIQKDQEQQYKYLKFDCEMRAKAVGLASSLPTSKNVKSLLDNTEKIAKYIFGMVDQPKEQK